MNFLNTIFGRNAPTTKTAAAALARVEADLAAAPARIAAAEAALVNVADMNDEEHAAAIAERDAAHRSAARLAAQVEQLQGALAEAEKAEAADALAARAKAAGGMLVAYAGFLDRHGAQATALAETLAKMAEVEREIAACNVAINTARRAGLKAPEEVETPDARYRAEPDVVTPDKKVVENKVQYWTGLTWANVGVTETREGKLVVKAGEQIRQVERIVPGSTKYGRRISSPTGNTILAPARIGEAAFWPKAS